MLAIVAPGQGSQLPGMLENWLQKESINKFVQQKSLDFEFDYEYFGSIASKEEISKTQITQPLLVLNSIISFNELKINEESLNRIVFSGHSVGEIVSYCLSGVINVDEALQISLIRGKSMSDGTKQLTNTGMAALLGNLDFDLSQMLETLDLQVANVNSAQQIVIGGQIENIDKLIEHGIQGIKIIKLPVSAAFHTRFMNMSSNLFSKDLESFKFRDPKHFLISNFNGELINKGQDAKQELIGQITKSVRWDLCQKTFKELGVTGLLELSPGGVLTGISKRENPEIEIFAIKNLSDVSTANDFIIRHT